MKKDLGIISIFFLILSLLTLGLSLLVNSQNNSSLLFSPISFSVSASNQNIAKIDRVKPQTSFGQINDKDARKLSDQKVNILLLGLDSRVGKKKAHCDAIHMISIKLAEGKIIIHSLPRGTVVNMKGVEEGSSYLANACSIYGIDYTVGIIESMLGIKADYKVSLGFSQAQGIFRAINLEPIDTLTFLRNRRYTTGDYQRSHNQALFLKDMLVNHLAYFARLPYPIQHLLYKMVDTDIDFEQASNLIRLLLANGVYKNPDSVGLKSYASAKVTDIHLADFENEKNSPDKNDKQFLNYQNIVENYLQQLINQVEYQIERNRKENAYQMIKTPFTQQVWQQIEDKNKRYYFQFELTRLLVTTTSNKQEAQKVLQEYIYQAETLNLSEYKDRANKLLEQISKDLFS